METRIACPHCEGHILVETDVFGSAVSCPHCNTDFTVEEGMTEPEESAQTPEESAGALPHPGWMRRCVSRLTWRKTLFAIVFLVLLADLIFVHILLLSAADSSASAASAAWSVEHELTSTSGYRDTLRKKLEQIEDDVGDIERELTMDGSFSDTIKQRLKRIASDVSNIESTVDGIETDVKYIRRNQ